MRVVPDHQIEVRSIALKFVMHYNRNAMSSFACLEDLFVDCFHFWDSNILSITALSRTVSFPVLKGSCISIEVVSRDTSAIVSLNSCRTNTFLGPSLQLSKIVISSRYFISGFRTTRKNTNLSIQSFANPTCPRCIWEAFESSLLHPVHHLFKYRSNGIQYYRSCPA